MAAIAAQADAATRWIYVTNLRGSSVSVVDPATHTVVATIGVGRFPEGAAVSPDGSQVWVVNDGDNNVSVIDAATNTVVATIPVGIIPGPLTFKPDGTRAYVGDNISGPNAGVAVIDTASDTVITQVPVGNQPFSLATTPDGSRLYSANFVGGSVSVIDTATNTVTATLSGGGMRTPTSLAVAPDGSRVYMVDFNANRLFVIDTATNTVTAGLGGLAGPEGVSITPDGAHLYIADAANNTVTVVETATLTITATIPVGRAPVSTLVDGTTAYVVNDGSNNVSVIDTTTNTVTGTIAVGAAPFGIAQQAVLVVPPIVTGLSPTHGPEVGGTTVTITGSHLTGATGVLFGTTPATGVTVVNDTTITAIAPAHEDGTVDVTVTTGAGTSATAAADRYTYDEPAPAITGLTPASGTLAGGTTVTITGTDFLGAIAVAFGATPATSFTVDSDTQITAVAPASASVGPVDVTVTTAAGTSTIGTADRYTYTYPFTGFLAPVQNVPVLNQVHAGQAIPIKFSLGADYGLGIIPAGFPTATQVNCATGAPVNTGTLTDTAGGSGLQYDPATNTYTYVWKTQKAWAGTCQVFTLGLNDTSSHTADFEFVN